MPAGKGAGVRRPRPSGAGFLPEDGVADER